MTTSLLRVLGLVAAVFLGAPRADAAPTTWVLEGTMSDGSPFSGSISFEVTPTVLAHPGTFFTVERSVYYRALTDLAFFVGGDQFFENAATPHNDFDVRYAMTAPNPVGDELFIFADVVSPQLADALSLSFLIRFFDPAETWLDNGDLPTPLPDLATLSQRSLVVRYQGPSGIVKDREGQITSVRIPEPSSSILVGIGLMACGLSRRFRHRIFNG